MANVSDLEAHFFAALEKGTAAERADYLDMACGGDAALRRQVDKLLRAHPRMGDFLSKSAIEQLVAAPEPSDVTRLFDDSTAGPREDSDLGFLQPSARPDSLGRLGHYEVLEVLGRGGFGIVFRAFDETLQRVVAVKVLAPQLAATSPARKRFLREARSSAGVRHENVVRVYAVEEHPLPYLVMEFIPGETLQQRLDRTGPLETAEVVQIGRQVAEGLAAAHARGLIHRDIKPANILIEAGRQQHVKITDFGLARAADDASMTQSGFVAGTPMYMAPEQANGETLDHRADLFSLGSVLYAICSGRPPFRARTALAVLKRVAEDAPRPIPEIIPEVPPWLCDIISRLQAKKPEDRFASAQEVADLLAQHLSGVQRPGIAPPVSETVPALPKLPPTSKPPAGPANRPRFRAGRWAAAAAVLLLLGGLGLTEVTGVTKVRGTVVRLFSPEGTLVVEVDDPGVSIKIDDSDLVITGAGAREIRLKPGKYTVEASKDGKVVRQELVTVEKNGRRVVRVTIEKAPADTKAVRTAVAWERSVAALPAAEQVKAVVARLKELNPDFDGKVAPMVENGVVTGLVFQTDQVSNISPLRVLTRLRSLECFGSDLDRGQLSDLSPLKGLPLTNLNCRYNSVSNLAPLKGMALTGLDLRHTKVSDPDVRTLAGLKGLRWLSLWGTRVTDAGLKDLAGLKSLQWLSLETTRITDLGLKELAGLERLEHLSLYNLGQVTDAGLGELAGLGALKYLDLRGTKGTDAGIRELATVLPSLRTHTGAGEMEPRENLDPDRRAAEYVLTIGGTVRVNAQAKEIRAVADLPREPFRLTQVALSGNRRVRDAGLANFKGCKTLAEISLNNGRVSDLAPLTGIPLRDLSFAGTKVTDLRPLKDMISLRRLHLGDLERLTDLSPLKGLPLEQLHFSNFKAGRDSKVLRAITTLKTINDKPAAAFWKEVDAEARGR